MSISFEKDFKNFEDGIIHLLEVMPDLKYYIGSQVDERSIIIELLNVIKEDIPFVTNENYPNTFSLTVSAEKVEFKTDEGYSFGWNTYTNNNTMIGYQFILSFINLSRSRRGIVEELISNGWEEKTTENKIWRENNNPPRISINEEETIVIKSEEEPEHNEDTDVQDVSVTNDEEKDYSQTIPLPTFDHVDENTEDTDIPKEEEIKRPTINPLKRSLGKYAPFVKQPIEEIEEADTIEVEEEPIQIQEPPKKRLLGLGLRRRNVSEVVEVEDAEQKEPIVEDINEMAEAQNLLETRRQMILPNGQITESTKHLEESSNTGLIELDPSQYNIRPTERPDKVIITFEGEEMPINVNESTRGIVRDPANKKLIIDTVVYDYKSFRVFGLPDNYEPDQAINIEPIANMRRHGFIPDKMFVPQETIMRNADIDVKAIQEEAIKREDFQTRLTGVKPSYNWNRGSLNNKNSGNVLKRGKGFVIDRQNKPNVEPDNTNQTQSVQITNEEGNMFGGRGPRW